MNFRLATINKLISEIKTAGTITDIIKADVAGGKQPVAFKPLGSVGAGTTVLTPMDPVKPDGSVDFIIQIRGIAGGDVKTASQIGKNAVIITAEAGGMGSAQNAKAFGNAGFINDSIGKVLAQLQKQHPDVTLHRGKLTISSFSGGGSATANLIAEKGQIKGGVDRFVFMDGLHSDFDSLQMKAVVQYAEQVANDPSKGELDILHSAVQVNGYNSTTKTSDHVLDAVGLKRTKLDNQPGVGPASTAQKGGLKVIQLYDKPDPYMIGTKVNVPGTAGYQHIQSLKWGLKNLL